MSTVIKKNQIIYMMLATLFKNPDHFYKQQELFYASKIPSDALSLFNRIFKTLNEKDYVRYANDRVAWNNKYTIKQLHIQNKDLVAYIDNEKYYVKCIDDQYPLDNDIAILKIDDRKLLKASLITLLKRKKIIIDGVVRKRGNYAFFTPENRSKCPYDVYLTDASMLESSDTLVAIEINPYDLMGKPCGSIYKHKENIVSPDANDQFIVKNKNIEIENKQCDADANRIKNKISHTAMSSRVNMIDEEYMSIGDTGKAVSISRSNGMYTVKYHIADVAHFISEGSGIDNVSYSRCLTHNLESRNVPMLPTEFGSKICNLTLEGKKLTICSTMIFDGNGVLQNVSFSEAIVKNVSFIPDIALSTFMDEYDEVFEAKYASFMDQIYMLDDLCNLIYDGFSNKKKSYIDVVSGSKASKWLNIISLLVNINASMKLKETNVPVAYKSASVLEYDSLKYAMFSTFDINVAKLIKTIKNMSEDNKSDILGSLMELVPDYQKKDFRKLIDIHLHNCFAKCDVYNWIVDEYNYTSITNPLNSYYDLYVLRILKQYIRKTIRNEAANDERRNTIDGLITHLNRCEEKACKVRVESYKFALFH